jgi:hypothetical protein
MGGQLETHQFYQTAPCAAQTTKSAPRRLVPGALAADRIMTHLRIVPCKMLL